MIETMPIRLTPTGLGIDMNEVTFREQKYLGYGSGPSWRVDAIYKNRRLETRETDTEREHGIAVAELRAKWGTVNPAQISLDNFPLASPWCDHCGADTIGGGSHCVGKVFCDNCRVEHMPRYIQEYNDAVAARKEQDEARYERERQERIAATEAATASAFHWRDGWFFRRLEDGAVRVMHRERPSSEYLRIDLIIPENEWASIICSVSKLGETADRWDAARAFHGVKD